MTRHRSGELSEYEPNSGAKEVAGKRVRQNSLRNVKDSKEILRQRCATKSANDIAPDGNSVGREGRQFTVGNVGNNGVIYLRYVLLARNSSMLRP